jgi:hypothetical protein
MQRNVPPSSTVFVHASFGPHAAFLLPNHKVAFFEEMSEISLMSSTSWVADWRVVPGGMNFVRPHNSLWKVLRRRNFESSVSRVASLISFGDGWYPQEGGDASVFRWMSNESHATLPVFPGSGRLSISMYVPLDAIPPPTIEIAMNGKIVDRFVGAEADITRSWVVPSRADAPNELRITTSGTVNPSRSGKSTDTRELGLRINALTWTPVR